jgi:hypothetical protein
MTNAWNNLLKFLLLRVAIELRQKMQSFYRLCVRMLRKATPRIIRFRWLQRVINRLLRCPQMVHRYINPTFGIEQFFTILNERRIRYTILRWFEELPNLKKGDDIDMLVHDDDLPKIKDLFVVLPTGVPCDVYSVSALFGASYGKDVPLYPSHLAREILETSIMYKGVYRVPDTKHYFFSLAYHAVYHKAEMSGLPYAKGQPLALFPGQRSYMEKLVALAEECDVKVNPDFHSLHEMLSHYRWTPRIDVLRRTAKRSEWLSTLVRDITVGKFTSSQTIRYPLNVHGVRLLIESDSAAFIEYVRRDFCFFQRQEADLARPDIRLRFLKQVPPWEEIPRDAVPLFKTDGSIVYKQGPNRYVDHNREVLAIYDLKREHGTVYSDDPDAMYRIAYSLLMTRVGLRLDAARRHRMHALGITINDSALLFLANGGCGKTTLGLEMMKNSEVGWLTDDILPVESTGGALAFPTSPRLIQGSVVPWLPHSVKLLKAPMPKHPPKVQLPVESILPRICPATKMGGLFLCSRTPGIGPSVGRVSFPEAFVGICQNALTGGRAFGQMKAYSLQFSPVYIYRMAAVYISRARTFMHLAWTVPVFRFEMGSQVSENALMILSRFPTTGDAACNSKNVSNNIPRFGEASGIRPQVTK